MELSERDERERIITRLNNNYGEKDKFPEIYDLSDQELDKVVQLFKQESIKNGKDPWHYTHFDEVIVMEKCVWEVIKDNPIHDNIKDKLKNLFENELNRKLTRYVKDYGEETDETYQASYKNKSEEAIILAKMCEDQIKRYTSDPNRNLTEEDIAKINKAMDTYNNILDDLKKAGISIPEDKTEEVELPTINEIIVKINEEHPNVISIMDKGVFEIDGDYRLSVLLDNGARTSISTDKNTYDALKNYFSKNSGELSTHISKQKQEIEPTAPLSNEDTMPTVESPSTDYDGGINNINQRTVAIEENQEDKEQYINEIIKRMLNAGEFHDSSMDISRKMDDIEIAKRHLRTKTIDELEMLYNAYDAYQMPSSGFGGK